MQKTLLISLVSVSFILGVGFGYYLTPEYSILKRFPSHQDGLGKPDAYLNLRFINGMIAHHLSAIHMLNQVQKETNRDELKKLADVVIDLDTNGIKDLYELKRAMYQDDRVVKNFNKVNLGSADEKFDLRFLNAMIIHHEEAISASREALTKSSDKKILEVADAVINLLSENLNQLKAWRSEWYSIK